MEIKTSIVLFISIATLGTFSTISANAQPSSASSLMNATTAVTFEGTAMSTVDALPGHQGTKDIRP